MKLRRVRVSNFRALRHVDLHVSDYMSLVGPNGAGKSTILYALDWFFGNREIDHECRSYESQSSLISVEIWIEGIPDTLTDKLAPFSFDGSLNLKKTFNCADGHSSFTGSAFTGDGFSKVLESLPPAQMRESYRLLRKRYPTLEELSGSFGKDRIQEAFNTWCQDKANKELLVKQEVDASHLMKRDGAFFRHFKFILVQGAMDFAGEIDTKDRNSLMSVLTKSLLDGPQKPIIDEWKQKHRESLGELETSLLGAVNESLASLNTTINNNLFRYDRNLKFQISARSSGINIDLPSSLDASVVGTQGLQERLDAQGHGVQRTVVMSMIEALNANRELGEERSESLVIIAAEEPELYQHPVRARSFFRTLRSLADQDGFQIMIATHSPEFISSDFITSLRFVRKNGLQTHVKSTTLETVAAVRNQHPNQIHEWLTKELPKSMSDAFFADLVLLTEGETDEALWPEIADLLDKSFDHHGIVCMSVGSKTSLVAIRDVLQEFGVSSFLVADGDYIETDNCSQKEQTEELVRSMGLLDDDGNPKYSYGDASQVFDEIAIFRQRIEEELEGWASYQQAWTIVNPKQVKKKAHHYRMAARRSAREGMPALFESIVDRVIAMAQSSAAI